MKHFLRLTVLQIIDAAKTVAIWYLTFDFLRWLIKYLARYFKTV